MGSEVKKGVLHFSISGEFITRHTRRLWAEGAAALALKTLLTGLHGMDEAIALKILTGQKKLTGWNSQIALEDDNATKDDRGLKLPRSLHEVLSQKDHALEREKLEHRKTAAAAAGTFTRLEDRVLDPSRKYGPTETLEAVQDVIGPNAPMPEQDWKHDWTCGWLTPDGEFYGCEFGGHQTLCEKLGEDSYRIELRGWIKYQRREWIGYFGKDPITQKQIDAIWDWSQATGKKYPAWISGGPNADAT